MVPDSWLNSLLIFSMFRLLIATLSSYAAILSGSCLNALLIDSVFRLLISTLLSYAAILPGACANCLLIVASCRLSVSFLFLKSSIFDSIPFKPQTTVGNEGAWNIRLQTPGKELKFRDKIHG